MVFEDRELAFQKLMDVALYTFQETIPKMHVGMDLPLGIKGERRSYVAIAHFATRNPSNGVRIVDVSKREFTEISIESLAKIRIARSRRSESIKRVNRFEFQPVARDSQGSQRRTETVPGKPKALTAILMLVNRFDQNIPNRFERSPETEMHTSNGALGKDTVAVGDPIF